MSFPEALQELLNEAATAGIPIGQVVLSLEMTALELKLQMLSGTAPQPEAEPLIKPASSIPK